MAQKEEECLNFRDRQRQILWRRDAELNDKKRSWNGHYRGCVLTASALLDLPCTSECKARCKQLPETDCSLLHFAQANIVKSVPRGKRTMDFEQHAQIPDSIPELLAEIELIRPTVIIVHGKSIHGPLQNCIETQHSIDWFDDCEHLAAVRWHFASPFESLIAFFRHPSRGWLGRDWDNIIVPTTTKIKNELLKRRNGCGIDLQAPLAQIG